MYNIPGLYLFNIYVDDLLRFGGQCNPAVALLLLKTKYSGVVMSLYIGHVLLNTLHVVPSSLFIS